MPFIRYHVAFVCVPQRNRCTWFAPDRVVDGNISSKMACNSAADTFCSCPLRMCRTNKPMLKCQSCVCDVFCTLSLWIGHRYIVIESFHSSDFSMTGRQIHGVTQSVGFTRPRYMSLWTRDVQRYIPLRCISCTTHTHTIYTIRTSVCRKGELENVWWWRKIMGKYCIWIESSLSLLQIYGWLCHVGTQRQCVECECRTENLITTQSIMVIVRFFCCSVNCST